MSEAAAAEHDVDEGREYWFFTPLRADVWIALSREAEARGMPAGTLASRLIQAIVRGNLYNAVINE
jgi:hypothetical protein